MKELNTYAFRNISLLLLAALSLSLTSCEKVEEEEFVLEGNIEKLLPTNAYSLTNVALNNSEYTARWLNMNVDLDEWNLKMKNVEYYLDGVKVPTNTANLQSFHMKDSEFNTGNHTLKTRFTISGDKINDVTRETETKFYVNSESEVSQKGDFFISYNYVTKGDYLVVEPELLAAHSTAGCAIDAVTYTWDGKVIATKTSAPFSLRQPMNDAVGTKHTLGVTIAYHDNNNRSLTYGYTVNDYKIYDTDEAAIHSDVKSTKADYKNGETLSLAAWAYEGSKSKENCEVIFTLDGKEIGSSTTFPYTLDYKLSGLSTGLHRIKLTSEMKKKDSKSSSSSEKWFLITK